MSAHPLVNYPVRWLVITLAALLSTPVAAFDVASCFNDSDSRGYIGIWAYERVTDWKAARARVEVTPTFVFSFMPGRDTYEVSDLKYCFFMPTPKTGDLVRCKSGSLRLSHVDVPRAVAGDYRFTLMNGEVKSLVFNASYCPPTKP